MQERMADMRRGHAEVTLRFSFMRLIRWNFSFISSAAWKKQTDFIALNIHLL